MSDQGVIRSQTFEERFATMLTAFFLDHPGTGPTVRRLLDEYGIVVTKRLEGTLVSTEEALALSFMDLGQMIPALESRLRACRRGQRRGEDRSTDIAFTERLLARAREMLDGYGPAEEGDVLWPVVERRPHGV